MPFALRENPESLAGDELDERWARGWFRMRQTLFTTHFLEFEDEFYSAVWLRVDLGRWQNDRRWAELQRRNRRFSVSFAPLEMSDDLEALFATYRDSVDIDVAPSLVDLLWGHETSNVFDSWMVRVSDGDRLVAAGVFDLGERAAAGITSFYDPAYRKHSLGRFVIYAKMAFCRERGLDWFYPGYLVPGRPQFDYKLAIATDQLAYLDLATGEWRDWDPEAPQPDPLALMVAKLSELSPRLWFNRHLAIHLSPQIRGVELFDFPVFVDVLPPGWGSGFLLVVFDPRDALYHLLHARSVYHLETTEVVPGRFDSDLLHVERLLYSSPDVASMAAAVGWVTA